MRFRAFFSVAAATSLVAGLSISAKRDRTELKIDFVDNGSGIDTDQQAVIFEKFARIGATKAGGAGLGLAICREIMARLGGDITYLPGQSGAAFRVTLPASVVSSPPDQIM